MESTSEMVFPSPGTNRMLVIMAKAPRPGAVKTRLASSLSPAAVTAFYCCLLDDTLALARSLGDVQVAIMCPAADVNELAQLAGSEVSVVAQKGEGLAAGLTSVFAHFAPDHQKEGFQPDAHQRRVIAFNSDSPHLPRSVLEDAFETLAGHDVVVGPTHDGGYYLVGAKASHPTFFANDGMGTSTALERLLSRARALELSVGYADSFYDIDVADDLTRLAEELRMAPARAPRTAAWLKEWELIAEHFRAGSSDGHGRTLRITRAWRVYLLGATLCVALTICSRHFGDRGGPYFMATLALAGIAYLLAVREFFVTPRFPRRVVVIGLILAAVWHIEFLRLAPGADDDIHRYVWDGRLQRLGYNPYLVVPGDPAAKRLHTPQTRGLNNPDLPSPYPPGAQLFFRAVTAIHESTIALKVAFVGCDLAIVLVLLDVLRSRRQGAHLVLAFAWNPLLAIEVAGSGHIDIVGALLLAVSVAALLRRWRATAAVALGLAVAVKFLPIVLLPLYWKRVRIRDAALAAAVVGLLYLPFLNRSFLGRSFLGGSFFSHPLSNLGRIPTGSLGTYVQNFRFNGLVFEALSRFAPPQLAVALAVLAGLATATWLRIRSAAPESSPDQFAWDIFAWPMAASLLCAPVVFPWYLLWLLPFLTSASTLLIIIWTVSIIPTYVQWHLRALGRPWGALPGWVMPVEYGCVAIAAAITIFQRITQTSYESAKRSR